MKEKLKEITKKVKGYFKDKKVSKKESLYIAIFGAICIVLISSVIVLKGINANKEKEASIPKDKEITLNVPEKETNSKVIENSERVENKKKQETKPVTSTPKLSFVNPIEGKLIKGNDEAIISADGMRSEMFGGITIEAKAGDKVKAGEVGVIDEVKKDNVTYGNTVTIKHPNGLKTEYCNLDATITVKKGDKVTKGQVIGKVGKSAQTLQAVLKCDLLHVKVFELKDKQYKEVDPCKYFSFKK